MFDIPAPAGCVTPVRFRMGGCMEAAKYLPAIYVFFSAR
jgi:hypothetical protein